MRIEGMEDDNTFGNCVSLLTEAVFGANAFDKGNQEGVAILGLCLRFLACSCITVMQLATCMSQYVSNSDIKLFVSQEVGFQCNNTPDTHHV